MCRLSALSYLCTLALLAACGNDSATSDKCSADSTLGLVQGIFEARGCTASTCHGAPSSQASAGLDLRPAGLYENVVNAAASTGDLPLVFPGDEERSVLYLKVAAKTLGTNLADFGVSGGAWYCAIFDNGVELPTTVRRHSERPDAAACEIIELFAGPLPECGCGPETRACLGGPNQGSLCGEDDAVCGDGAVCDACPLAGGITTEDEMFVIAGSYYVID